MYEDQSQITVQPIILIGAARSGTRLVRDTIAQYPDISRVPYDINFIWRLGNEKLPHDELSPDSLDKKTRERIRQKFFAFNKDKPYLIEKTVSNCLRVPFVDAVLPDAKYIHLIRDGWDVIESAYRQWTAKPDLRYILNKTLSYPLLDAPGYALSYAQSTIRKLLAIDKQNTTLWGPRYRGIENDIATKDTLEVCAIQWSVSVQKAHQDLSNIPSERVFELNYQTFVREPKVQLRKIGLFLGLDPDLFIQNIDVRHITSANIGKGKSTLTNEQRETIARYIKEIDLLLIS